MRGDQREPDPSPSSSFPSIDSEVPASSASGRQLFGAADFSLIVDGLAESLFGAKRNPRLSALLPRRKSNKSSCPSPTSSYNSPVEHLHPEQPSTSAAFEAPSWRSRDVGNWSEDDVVAWMLHVCMENGIGAEDVNCTMIVGCDGRDLGGMTEDEWTRNDPVHGKVFSRQLLVEIARSAPTSLPSTSATTEVLFTGFYTALHPLPPPLPLPPRSPIDPGLQSFVRSLYATPDAPMFDALGLVEYLRGESYPPVSQATISGNLEAHSALGASSCLQGVERSVDSYLPSITSVITAASPEDMELAPNTPGVKEVLHRPVRADLVDMPVLSPIKEQGEENDVKKSAKFVSIAKRNYESRRKNPVLWRFILDLLTDEATCPSVVRWLNAPEGVFRIMNSERFAYLWGQFKERSTPMNYDKLARSMRTYYDKGILETLPRDNPYPKKLTYKFGVNAKGWREHTKLAGR